MTQTTNEWPENRFILRGYTVDTYNTANEPAAVSIYDLQIDSYPVNHEWRKFFEFGKGRGATIYYLDAADKNKVKQLDKNRRYLGTHVYRIAGPLESQVYENVHPLFVKQLDPWLYSREERKQMLEKDRIALVGELPKTEHPTNAILKQAGISEHMHVERPPLGPHASAALREQYKHAICHYYNCPICEPLERFYSEIEKQDRLTDYLLVGEPYNSAKAERHDSLMYELDTFDVLATSTESLSIMATLSNLDALTRYASQDNKEMVEQIKHNSEMAFEQSEQIYQMRHMIWKMIEQNIRRRKEEDDKK